MYERMEAAHWRGYKDEEFDALDPFAQARIIAHYRCHFQLESVIAQATQRDAELRAKRNRSKG